MKTKSYDISVDSFVNVVVPEHYDPALSDHAKVIQEIALRKFRERLDQGEFYIDWDLRQYEHHNPNDSPDWEVQMSEWTPQPTNEVPNES